MVFKKKKKEEAPVTAPTPPPLSVGPKTETIEAKTETIDAQATDPITEARLKALMKVFDENYNGIVTESVLAKMASLSQTALSFNLQFAILGELVRLREEVKKE